MAPRLTQGGTAYNDASMMTRCGAYLDSKGLLRMRVIGPTEVATAEIVATSWCGKT